MSTSVFHPTLAKLLRTQSQAALGTTGPDGPHVSMVLVVPDADGPGMPFSGLLLHLSRRALHTRYLEADPRASLLLTRIDPTAADPQALPRVSVQGHIHPIARESDDYPRSTARYLARFPHAVQLFEFDDFGLYRFVPTEARYIGGSGQAFRLTAAQFCALQVPALRMTGRETG